MADEIGSAPAGNPAPEASAPAGSEAPAAGSGSWIDNVGDTDLRGWAESKGLQNATIENVVGSYRNLEKLIGADRAGRTVVMPGPDADGDALNEFYTKLGRPTDPKGYELPVPEGHDGKMAEWASGVFHEAGLTPKQAQVVAEKWNEYVGGMSQESQAAQQAQAQQAEAALRKEWGAAYEQKVNGIEQAASALGMNEKQLLGLREAMGPAAAMKFIDGLAEKLGESPIDSGGENRASGVLTPAAASEQLKALGTDKEFMDAWMNKSHPSHQWAVEKKSRLARMAAGQAA